ncbi:probable transcriptional regulator [Oceanicola granulosus HTCC2516]|uniref:Probable transcriptional regulator n=1 Tax=Oceanicola granulosus (strain ATCC BAA-861 / DSM 15982 / KCTC 12143 / HTCC2516) TaxID=314256 RepID=Q2CEW8_OCEGH|nr:cupin domain-containing protein [Oceanicola granulosus]EAR51242.1 probable transcriptional regulator [Oceanicola granulosus HTCC2516]
MSDRQAWPEQSTDSKIGAALRRYRKSQGMTLRDVAEGAGLSTGFISQAERDIAVPSLSSLRKIAQVLGVSLQDILPETVPAMEASRRSERRVYSAHPGSSAAMAYERISTTFPGATLSSVIMRQPPGHRSELQSHDGEEIFFVLEGCVTIELDGERIILHPGDSLHFSSRRPHATWNHTTEIVLILHVCTIDVFGDRLDDDA